MAINRVLAPVAPPTSGDDFVQVVAQLAALVLDKERPIRISGSNVLQGAFFNVGGVLYVAASATAITGSASDFVKITPSGATASAAFVADLTGVTWNATYKGYYDASGNLYVFDELKALSSGAIATPSRDTISPKHLGTNWALALVNPGPNGANWRTAFAAALASGWTTILAAAIATDWTTGFAAGWAYTAGAIGIDWDEGGSTESGSYVLVSGRIYCKRAGTVRITFTLARLVAVGTAYGRVYKNGGAVGTERSVTTTDTFSEDFAIAAGDYLEIYGKSASSAGSLVTNIIMSVGHVV